MGKKPKDKAPEAVELEEMNIIIRIPKKTVSLDIVTTIMMDGKPQKCRKALDVEAVYKARKDFLENVEDGDDFDARYVLTPQAKEILERLTKEVG